jgi:hypothetical protein
MGENQHEAEQSTPPEQPSAKEQQRPNMQTCSICSTIYPSTVPTCPTCTLQTLLNKNIANQKVTAALLQLGAALAEANAANPTPRTTPSSPPSPPPPMQQKFNGRGQEVTSPFILNPGLARFLLTHSGKRHFGVWLIDARGTRIALLANAVGNFNGSKAVGINLRGQYLINVDADGGWVIQVQQP